MRIYAGAHIAAALSMGVAFRERPVVVRESMPEPAPRVRTPPHMAPKRPLTEGDIRRLEAAAFKRERKAKRRAEIAAKGGFRG